MRKIHPSAWLRAALAACLLVLAALDFFIVPSWGWSIANSSPELNAYYWPWLVFVWLASVPIYAALAAVWKLSLTFRLDRPAGKEGAKLLRLIARLAAGDSAFTALGTVVLALLNLSQPGVMLLLLFAVILGLTAAAGAAGLADVFEKMERA